MDFPILRFTFIFCFVIQSFAPILFTDNYFWNIIFLELQ